MNKEILTVVEVVSNEKGVAKEVIFEALEAALASATKKRYHEDIEVRVAIDRKSGDYKAFRRWELMGGLEFPDRQVLLSEARKTHPGIKAGEFIEEPMEAEVYGRIAAQTAKQVIVQKVREAERAQVVEQYQGRKGQLVSGTVKRSERSGVLLDLGGNA